jgi:hypothetical protein
MGILYMVDCKRSPSHDTTTHTTQYNTTLRKAPAERKEMERVDLDLTGTKALGMGAPVGLVGMGWEAWVGSVYTGAAYELYFFTTGIHGG